MGKNSELLDRAIDYMVTFPVTTLGVLFRPAKVLSAEHEERRCPPGVAFVLGVTVWFVGNRTILRIRAGDLVIPLVPAADEIARIIVGTAAFLLIQALVLSAILKKRYSGWDWRTSAQYLAYPIATTFLCVGVVKLLSVHFPGAIQTLSQFIVYIECRFDSEIGNCAEWVKLSTTTFPSQLDEVTNLVAIVVYLWALYNVIRISFGLRVFKSMGMTLLVCFVSATVFAGGFWIVYKTKQSVMQRTEELAQERQRNSASKGAEQ